jgi:hypothetical protein
VADERLPERQQIWQEPPVGGLVDASLLIKPWREIVRLIDDGGRRSPGGSRGVVIERAEIEHSVVLAGASISYLELPGSFGWAACTRPPPARSRGAIGARRAAWGLLLR